eukprot:576036-Pleurochrysis_carterae.AAC.1
MTISTNTDSHWSGSRRRRGAGRNYGAAQGRRRSLGKGGHRERVSKSLGSGARALRKHACDATAKWQTVHVSVACKCKARATTVYK